MKRMLLLAGVGLSIYAVSLGSSSIRYAGSSDCAYSNGNYNIQDTIPKDTTKKKKRDTSSAVLAPMPMK